MGSGEASKDMARTLEQVQAELDPYYDSSRKVYQSKLDSIGGEIEAGIAQADAKLGQANDNILAGARRRGLGFAGIPVAEQAKYAATEYAPAIANMKSAGKNQELGLLEALNGLNREKRTQAQSIYESDLSRDFAERQFQESQRQFNEQMAAQAKQAAAARAASTADISRYLGGGGASKPQATASQSKPGSFSFADAGGKAITANQYAQATGRNIGDLLFEMGQAGDATARDVYNQLKPLAYDQAKFNKAAAMYAKSVPWLMGAV